MTYDPHSRRPDWLDSVDAEGNLERPLIADQWLAPGSSLGARDGRLELDGRAFFTSPRIVKAGPRMLEQFVRLAESGHRSDEAVLRYARRWGLLDLCEHQLPIQHDSEALPISFGVSATFATARQCRSLAGREPVATWLYWSRQATALLAVLSRLRRSEPGRSEDWLVASEQAPWATQEPVDQELLEFSNAGNAQLVGAGWPLEVQRTIVSGAIESWLRLAGVSLGLRWTHGVAEVGVRTGGLAGALGLQLMLTAAGSSGWLVCAGCGTLTAPRKTRYRRRTYCDECRASKVPQHRASQRSRAKKAADPTYREAERVRVREYRLQRAARPPSSAGGSASV